MADLIKIIINGEAVDVPGGTEITKTDGAFVATAAVDATDGDSATFTASATDGVHASASTFVSAIPGEGAEIGQTADYDANEARVFVSAGATAAESAVTVGINNATALVVGSDGTAVTVKMPGLPTADPHVADQLWNDGGVLTVSSG